MAKRISMTRLELVNALALWEEDMRDDRTNRYVNDSTRFKQHSFACAEDLADWFVYWLERAKVALRKRRPRPKKKAKRHGTNRGWDTA